MGRWGAWRWDAFDQGAAVWNHYHGNTKQLPGLSHLWSQLSKFLSADAVSQNDGFYDLVVMYAGKYFLWLCKFVPHPSWASWAFCNRKMGRVVCHSCIAFLPNHKSIHLELVLKLGMWVCVCVGVFFPTSKDYGGRFDKSFPTSALSTSKWIASWDDCERTFLDKRNVSLVLWWVPTLDLDSTVSPLCHYWVKGVHSCLAVTCHLHFWQNDRGLLHATAVTQGWHGYKNKNQQQKFSLEIIDMPLLPGIEPACYVGMIWMPK